MASQSVSECGSESYGIVVEYTDSIQLQELCSWQMSNASIWTSTPPLKRQRLKNGWDDTLWKNHLDQENLPVLHITHIQLYKGTAMAMDYMAEWEETMRP